MPLILEEDYLAHYGTPRHSGRYPWGSGKNPQRNKSFYTKCNELKKQGLSEKEIATALDIRNAKGEVSVTKYRAMLSAASNDVKKDNIAKAIKLREKGWSYQAIADEIGVPNESTVRGWIKNEGSESKRNDILNATRDALKESVANSKYGYVDIGPGMEQDLNVTATRMGNAVELLKDQGYQVFTPRIPQPGNPGKMLTMKVLVPPGVTFGQFMKDIDNDPNAVDFIKNHVEINTDTGKVSQFGIEDPIRIPKDRVYIRYAEDGGDLKDGVIELRRNVEELNLEKSRYAQVRIAVEGDLYAKGMAIYGDDIPDGYDIVVNSNKKRGTPIEKALKPMYYNSGKNKPIDEPFSSSVVQHHYIGKDGKEHLSALNIIGSTERDQHVEGSWGEWSKKISAQFLSKQDPKVAKRQLDITYKQRLDELEEIKKITNPVVRKNKLEEFAKFCDSDAVHLKAAGFPRQATKVILPFDKMKENEIYAPGYSTGEEVALVRFPHAGTFEIPTLKVNNSPSNPAYKLIHNAKDAVGINPKVAPILSGADFDGDTVVVIPLRNQNLKTRRNMNLTKDLESLQDFDPKAKYKLPDSAPVMKSSTKQKLMGEVSNLITDMTIKGASSDELARAVRHSMVVIDAEKHHLDYKQSAKDENIGQLKKIYQNNGDGKHGASTLISRAKSEQRVDERRDYWLSKNTIDEEGNKIYKETGNSYQKIQVRNEKTGKLEWRSLRKTDVITPDTKIKTIKKTTKSTKMEETKDALTLMSGPNHEGSDIERVYGNYANNLKSLANTARKLFVETKETPYSPAAAKIFSAEVNSLKNKVQRAAADKPKERRAQLVANTIVNSKTKDETDLTSEDLKKINSQALNSARRMVYGDEKRYVIDISDKEWEAIQAGAVSNTMLRKVLSGADSKQISQLSMPRDSYELTDAQISRIRNMTNNGYNTEDIADAMGISTTTVNKYADD